jgi:hypothetical protein
VAIDGKTAPGSQDGPKTALNFSALRKFALALLRRDETYPKRSLCSRRKTADRIPQYRASLLGLVQKG